MITGKGKLEEQCKISQKNILKLNALQNALLLNKGRLKNYSTITIQNLDVTPETKAKLRANKRELKTKSHQQWKRNRFFTQNVLDTYKTESNELNPLIYGEIKIKA